MKWISCLFLFFLFFPLVLGVAVTPVSLEGSGEFIVVNNLDEVVDYVIEGDFVCSPNSFSLGADEMQKVLVQGSGVGEVLVYEIVDLKGIGLVNGVAVKVDNSVSNRITGDAVFDFSSYSSTDYSWVGLAVIVLLVLGIVVWKNKEWLIRRLKRF
jgi:hypothetical protein